MIDLNVIVFSGRLTADSDVRKTQSGKDLTMFTVAVNDDYKTEKGWVERAYFFPVIFKGEKKITKGSKVLIEGKLTQNKKVVDGVNRTYMSVVANKIMTFETQPKQQTFDQEFEQNYADLQKLREQKPKQEVEEQEIPF